MKAVAMKAIITTKRYVAYDTLETTVCTAEPVHFSAGQAMLVTLPTLSFQDLRGPRRFFSIVNAPIVKDELVFTTRIRRSGFKQTLRELTVGSEIDIMLTGGKFVLPEDANAPLVFIAGGIGITPFLSMLRQLDSSNALKDVTLLYANRRQEDAPYLDELQELAQRQAGFSVIPIMTRDDRWHGEKQLIDKELILKYIPSIDHRLFYLSGSNAMVQNMQTELHTLGVADKNIATDILTGY